MTPDPRQDIRSTPVEPIDLRYAQLRLADPIRVARLRELLEVQGLRQPLLVSDRVEAGKLVLIDGFKRLEALRGLGLSEVLVRVLSLDAVAAEVAIINANLPGRGLAQIEEGFIVQSLHRVHGRTQTEIAELLGRHKSWVSRRLSLVEQLAPDVLEDLRLGLICATVARELARLPRGTQPLAARAVAEHGLSSREATGLLQVAAATAEPTQRCAVLENPLAHLPAKSGKRKHPSDPRLRWLANQLRRQMLWLEATANRILELFRVHGAETLEPRERRILGALASEVLPRARNALVQIETHADPQGRGEDDESPGAPATPRL